MSIEFWELLEIVQNARCKKIIFTGNKHRNIIPLFEKIMFAGSNNCLYSPHNIYISLHGYQRDNPIPSLNTTITESYIDPIDNSISTIEWVLQKKKKRNKIIYYILTAFVDMDDIYLDETKLDLDETKLNLDETKLDTTDPNAFKLKIELIIKVKGAKFNMQFRYCNNCEYATSVILYNLFFKDYAFKIKK
jgi:hypothetical protein